MPNTVHEDIKINNTWLLSLGSSNSNGGRLTKNPIIFMYCVNAVIVKCFSHIRSRNSVWGNREAFSYENNKKKTFMNFDYNLKFIVSW